ILLLDGKRSLNVNIFLKQFRSSNEDIIHLIKNGDHDEIGTEKLRGLLKILPQLDELEMLRNFDGDKSRLGNAEKFLLQLIQVPNYKLRIESMLLKEEFATNMSYLEPSINSMIVAGEDLMSNKALQEVLYMVICAGNFLNSGGYAGNAAGVKLSSLQKLTDIRANKPGMNLIHYVALQAEKKRKELLNFTEDMGFLEEATKTTVEQLQNEINLAIEEERKGFIGALGQETGDESLTVYIRRPSHAPDPRTMTKRSTVNQKANNTTVINISSTPSDKQHCSTLPPLGSSKGQFPDMGVTDKIEIDSDNIETPPATRKLLALNKAALAEKKPKLGDEATLGDGQFDRFSAARRTRRYRKNTDEENAGRKDGTASVPTSELIPSKQLIRPNTLQVQSVAVNKLEPQDSESRLKRWKDKIQYKDTEEDAMMHITKSGEELKNLQRSATLPRSTRFRSIMNRKIIGEDTYTPVKVDGETTARDSVDGGNINEISPTARDSVDGGNINVSISSMGSDKVNTLSTLGRQSPMSPKPTNVNLEIGSPGEVWAPTRFGNRKSWGSLDRSWARRARGGGPGFKKRPELLNADFYGDRERPGSPSPLIENKPIVPAPSTSEEDIKPKAWKAKIEAWLQENEKEGKQAEESTRRVPKNRWSLEDSESDGRSGTLDPLPEGKLALNTSYKPVYSEWKPTFDKTDVVGAMEAIAEAQPAVKDKSLWRKSNLNVANSTEEIEADARKIKRMKSQTNQEPVSTLQAIEEERKGFIGALGQETGDESLTVYIRRPSHAPDPRTMTKSSTVNQKANNTTVINISSTPSDKQHCSTLPPLGSSKGQFPDMGVTDKIEIDSDNIETPPATRKLLALNKAALAEKKPKLGDEATLGDGQFDRFSAARRTRRYRKNTDEENAGRKDGTASVPTSELIPSKQLIRPNTLQVQSVAVNKLEPQDSESRLIQEDIGRIQTKKMLEEKMEPTICCTRRYRKNTDEENAGRKDGTASVPTSELIPSKQLIRPNTLQVQSVAVNKLEPQDSESRLKRWKDKIQYKDTEEDAMMHITKSGEELKNLQRSATLPRSTRFRSIMNRKIIGEDTYTPVKVDGETSARVVDVPIYQGMADHEVTTLKEDMQELESVRKKLADFFCEDSNVFKLEECYKVFHGFCVKFKQAVAENERRRIQEEQSAARRRQREEQQLANKRKFFNGVSGDVDPSIVESLICETAQKRPLDKETKLRKVQNGGTSAEEDVVMSVPSSPAVMRRRLGSLSGDPNLNSSREDNFSIAILEDMLNSASSVSTIRPANTIPGIKKYTHAIKSLTENLQNTKGPTAQKTKTPVPASRSSSSGSSIGPTLRKTMKTTASSDIKENVNVTAPSRVAASRSSSSSSSIAGLSFMRPTAASTAKDCKLYSCVVTNVNISDNLVPSSKVKSEFIPEIRVQAITPNKHRELDMHDEGFEESQSLVSETLSQGTSSGNFEQENVSPTNKNAKLYRADSSGSADTTSSNPTHPVTLDRNKPVSASFKHENKPTAAPIKRSLSLRRASPQTSGIVKTNAPVQSTVQSKVLTPRNTQSNYKPLTRSNSVNKPQQPPVVKKAFPLEKSGSKSSLKGAPLRKKVERSNSKSSLQSSRSSLNSASSVSTIRPANNIPGIKKYTHAIKSLTENLQNTKGPTAQKTLCGLSEYQTSYLTTVKPDIDLERISCISVHFIK
ncbi:uncharacterized protein LOC103508941, partial [Diaphorina citri]|uniref:Uncharacterized protein LOC103508941 n=1 Tax=Diaphorina citri TaxID=121845 RepID=A0A1S4EB60_DIACI